LELGAGKNKGSNISRRLRLANLRKLFRDRNGPILPDDDAGREYLVELLLPISVGPHADIKMACSTNAATGAAHTWRG
jgi:hypothetical protein